MTWSSMIQVMLLGCRARRQVGFGELSQVWLDGTSSVPFVCRSCRLIAGASLGASVHTLDFRRFHLVGPDLIW